MPPADISTRIVTRSAKDGQLMSSTYPGDFFTNVWVFVRALSDGEGNGAPCRFRFWTTAS